MVSIFMSDIISLTPALCQALGGRGGQQPSVARLGCESAPANRVRLMFS
jgi:hypothetical protein